MMLSSGITEKDLAAPDYTNAGIHPNFPQHAMAPGNRPWVASDIVNLHVALRTPCNLVRTDQASYDRLQDPARKASLDRILRDGIIGYAMVITDPVLCGVLHHNQQDTTTAPHAMGMAYIWDQFYVGEKKLYDEHEIISILFYHLHQLRMADPNPDIIVKIHVTQAIFDIVKDRGQGNILELLVALCSAPNQKNTWLVPTFKQVVIVVDAYPARLEDKTNYEVTNMPATTADAMSPATIAVASIERAEQNPPTMIMGCEARSCLYTARPFPTKKGETEMTAEGMKALSDVSEKIGAVVTCARVSTAGEMLFQTVPFHQHIGHELAQQMYVSAVLMKEK